MPPLPLPRFLFLMLTTEHSIQVSLSCWTVDWEIRLERRGSKDDVSSVDEDEVVTVVEDEMDAVVEERAGTEEEEFDGGVTTTAFVSKWTFRRFSASVAMVD